MAAFVAATAANSGLGSRAALPEINTTEPFEAFKASQALHGQQARPVQLKRHSVVPLRVAHLEQINLRHRARNIDQRIDSAKAFERLFNDELGRLGFSQVKRRAPWPRPQRIWRPDRVFLQLVLISRYKHNG